MRFWKAGLGLAIVALAVGFAVLSSQTPETTTQEPPSPEARWQQQFAGLYPQHKQELMEAYRVLFTLRTLAKVYSLWSYEMPSDWSTLQADLPLAVDWTALGTVFGEPVQLVDAPSDRVGSTWVGTWEVGGKSLWTVYLRLPEGITIQAPVTSQELQDSQHRPPEGNRFYSILYDEREWVEGLPPEDRAWYFTCVVLLWLPGKHEYVLKAPYWYPAFLQELVPEIWATPEDLIYGGLFIGEVLRNPYTGDDLRSSLREDPAPRSVVWRARETQPSGQRFVFGCLDEQGALLNVAAAGLSLAREGVPIRLPESYPRDLYGYRLLKGKGLLTP